MEKMKLNIQKFASGTITFPASGYLQGKIDWSSVAGTAAENTSKITTKLYARRTNSYETSGKLWSGWVQVGNNTKHSFSSVSSVTAVSNSWVLFGTYSDTIAHNDDGTCSVKIAGAMNGCTNTSLEGKTSSGSSTVTLDTISRPSVLSITDEEGNEITSATVGDTIRINIDRKSSTFYESLFLLFTSSSEELHASGFEAIVTETYYDYTITNDTFANYLPGKGCSLLINGTTYTADGTAVLETNQVSIDIEIPESMIPNVELSDIIDKGGIVPSDWGIFVEGKSDLYIPYTVSGIYGSTITKTWLTWASAPGEQLVNTTNPLIGEFPIGVAKQNDTITIYTQDSRNKIANASKSFTVVDYTNPVLTTYTAQKVDADLNPSDSGEYVLFEIDGTIANCEGKNEKKKYIGFKSGNSINWINITSEGATVLMDQPINPNIQNTIYFKIEDSLGESDIKTVILDSAFNLMNFNKTLTAVAIGKKSSAAADEKKFEIACLASFLKGFISKSTGNVNTQDGENSLVVKQTLSSIDNTPGDGAVLEYSTSASSGGQLFIGNNSSIGCYYNGWTDGEKLNSWEKILMKQDLLEMVYPVGSIYMSAENNNPSSFLGGTWEALYDRMLVGAGSLYSAGDTGGSADAVVVEHTHTGTIASSGAHYHTSAMMSSTTTSTSGAMILSYSAYGSTRSIRIPYSGNDGAHKHAFTTDATGSTAEGANMPPYLGVYMWKRTA